jgi:hypothetical protein
MRPGPAVTGLLALLCLLSATDLSAQLQVEITPPELEEGLAQLEALVAVEVNAAAAEVTNFVNSVLEKPGILRGIGDATAAAATLRPNGAPSPDEQYRISIGSTVGVAAEVLHWDTMKDRIERLEQSDDMYVGAGANPLVLSFAFPAARLVSGLWFHTGAGYVDSSSAEFDVRGLGVSAAAGYPVLRGRPLGDYFSHTGVAATLGASVLQNEVSAVIEPGTVRQTFVVDPDGEGPVFGQDVSVEVDPEIEAAIESTVYSFSLGASTGIELLGFLGLSLGGTGEVVFGEASLSLSSDDEIEFNDYLSDLVAEDGQSRLVVSGSTEAVSPAPVQFSAFTALTFRVSSYEVIIPVSWRSNSGLGGGIFFGVAF